MKRNSFYQKHGKRIFDILISSIAIIFLLPIFIIVCFLIMMDSSGDIIFTQKRSGIKGKSFKIYKFRTMVKDAEKLKDKYKDILFINSFLCKTKNDPRVTKIGKFLRKSCLDELPQLFNIFIGDMSFVGPRPFDVNETKQLKKKHFKRLYVKPGLTSPWVAKGMQRDNLDRWMESDIRYVETISLATDIKTIAMTIPAILKINFKKRKI
jgi:lipopolysaccharide/colanic/teichoic acid biosynthesis glycosyltransferase